MGRDLLYAIILLETGKENKDVSFYKNKTGHGPIIYLTSVQ